jgi:hypothetical protein
MNTISLAAEQVTKMAPGERICKHCGERIYNLHDWDERYGLRTAGYRAEWTTVFILNSDPDRCDSNIPAGGTDYIDDLGPHEPGGELVTADYLAGQFWAALDNGDVTRALDELDAAVKLYAGVFSA